MQVQRPDREDAMPDYQSGRLKLKGLSNETKQESQVGFGFPEETNSDEKLCELEQTQKIFVELTEMLFKKVDGVTPNEKEFKVDQKEPMEKEPKLELTDISWYQKKLNTMK